MIIVSIAKPTYSEIKREVSKVLKYAALIEVRVDALREFDIEMLAKINRDFSPLFTLRSQEEGGHIVLNAQEREGRLKALIDLKPDYLDLEYERDLHLVAYLKKHAPKTKWICSYHDLCYFPKSIEALIKKMKGKKPWKVKIAAATSTILDAFKMLLYMKKHPHFIGIAMGERGQLSRLLGPLVQQPITYAAPRPGTSTASGQLSAQELEELFHYSSLSPKTKLLGIIGKPLKQSPGYKVYNPLFERERINALYVNVELASNELEQGLNFMQQLGFFGCSVTIPHKQSLLPFVDHFDRFQKGITSLNTLQFNGGKIKAKNTDGIGAKKCLEAYGSLAQKKVLILGAGGTAAGIGYVLKKAKADILIMNRTNAKAFELANELRCQFKPFELLPFLKSEDYDILVHTTSVGNDNPEDCLIPQRVIFPHKIVLDVVLQNTRLLKWARENRCHTINGYQFWISQAEEQFSYWFKGVWPRISKLMRRYLP